MKEKLNKELYLKLVKLYGKDNAKDVYYKMQQSGDDELKELLKMSLDSEYNVSFEQNSSIKR